MSYVSIYDMQNPKLSYEIKRKSLLQALFRDNLELAGCLDPFMYEPDLYDILIDEQYTLIMGGDEAVKYINDRLEQLEQDSKDYADDEDATEAINDVKVDLTIYLREFVNKEG